MVVARDRYIAEDAADAIVVQYEPLPVVADIELAAAPDAPARAHGPGGQRGRPRGRGARRRRRRLRQGDAHVRVAVRHRAQRRHAARGARRRRPLRGGRQPARARLDAGADRHPQRPQPAVRPRPRSRQRRRARRRRRLRRQGHPVLSRGGDGPARRPPARHGGQVDRGPARALRRLHARAQAGPPRARRRRRRRQDPRARDELPARQRRLLPVRADHPGDQRRAAAGPVPARQLPLRLHGAVHQLRARPRPTAAPAARTARS